MRPGYIDLPKGHSTSALPPGVTVDDILSDFFTYIKKNVQMFVTNSYTSGNRYWDDFAETMVVILTTPNGWEGRQQNKMREAAIKSKLLVGDRVRERVRFVSEGEVTQISFSQVTKISHEILHRLRSIMRLKALNHMTGLWYVKY